MPRRDQEKEMKLLAAREKLVNSINEYEESTDMYVFNVTVRRSKGKILDIIPSFSDSKPPDELSMLKGDGSSAVLNARVRHSGGKFVIRFYKLDGVPFFDSEDFNLEQEAKDHLDGLTETVKYMKKVGEG